MAKSVTEVFNFDFLFDSHCHLNSKKYDEDRENVISNAAGQKVEKIFDISTDKESISLSIDISKRNPDRVKSFVGIDPDFFIPGSAMFEKLEQDEVWFKNLEKDMRVIIETNRDFIAGIGETGIDNYWLKQKIEQEEITEDDQKQSLKMQKKLFKFHLKLAEEYELPLSIHSRDAEKECLKLVKKHDVSGIFHSYTGDYETAKRILDAGWGLGVNGIVTFNNSYEMRGMYKKILGKVSNDWSPSDFYKKGIFFETDSPYLAPEGKRGERNEPANVRMIFDSFLHSLVESKL